MRPPHSSNQIHRSCTHSSVRSKQTDGSVYQHIGVPRRLRNSLKVRVKLSSGNRPQIRLVCPQAKQSIWLIRGMDPTVSASQRPKRWVAHCDLMAPVKKGAWNGVHRKVYVVWESLKVYRKHSGLCCYSWKGRSKVCHARAGSISQQPAYEKTVLIY